MGKSLSRTFVDLPYQVHNSMIDLSIDNGRRPIGSMNKQKLTQTQSLIDNQ